MPKVAFRFEVILKDRCLRTYGRAILVFSLDWDLTRTNYTSACEEALFNNIKILYFSGVGGGFCKIKNVSFLCMHIVSYGTMILSHILTHRL